MHIAKAFKGPTEQEWKIIISTKVQDKLDKLERYLKIMHTPIDHDALTKLIVITI